jgi:hypothetical protein
MAEEESSTAIKRKNKDAKGDGNDGKKKKRKKKGKRKGINHIKDPKEAHSYLSTWKVKGEMQGVWKFNKNTQSWLIRKMYNSELLPKASFVIMLSYLEGLQGDSMKERIYEEAVRQIMRYKEWEKNGSKTVEEDEEEDENNDDEGKDNGDDDEDDNSVEIDNKRFKKLDAKEKRKEYKRARQVHDIMKASIAKSAAETD